MHRRIQPSGLGIGLFTLIPILLAICPASQGQSRASCKYQIFRLPGSHQESDQALGINSSGQVVGQALPNNESMRGFVRLSGGGVKYLMAPNSTYSIFTGINDDGVRIGNYIPNGSSTGEGFLWMGSTFTPIVDPNSASPYGTRATGINKADTVVGYYADSSGAYHSFMRGSDGKYTTLDYPGGQFTQAGGINRDGTIVGSFMDSAGEHGFIYHNSQWSALDYPGTDGYTQLLGISDAGTIIGFTTSTEPYTYFLYHGGAFKIISDSKAQGGTLAAGIAGNGLITGQLYLKNTSTSWHGFIAACKP